ncbi:alpha-galactosidase [Lacticaseibacillus rhamnosus]|uniref:alpha-galactosidase n=1 Tax=Lacticaseibacillus rhamnosus TaxID=47715 RepID=UPI0023E179D6|nr:alpha-galactosidase [Lacticaseibacillus rhamnosus]MDF3335698.1 alpha-galactosidase [Lacticaseibacillus rhamnosus]
MSLSNTSPIMGWSSWNYFRQNINEQVILETAKALKKSSLARAGYTYVNLDDAWQAPFRDAQGDLQFDPITFPTGTNLIDKIHSLGLKFGLYSSSGPMTCEDLPASFGNEERDAQRFADMQIDFLKYDYCHVVDLTTDEKLLDQVPPLISIEMLNQGTGQKYKLSFSDLTFSGSASLTTEDGLQVLTGLSYDRGKASLSLPKLKSDEYLLTITYHKTKSENRRLLVLKTESQQVNVFFPTTSGWSQTGRVQVILSLSSDDQTLTLFNPIHDRKSDAIWRYGTMHRALKAATKTHPINFAVCEHGRNQPWEWAPAISNSYRISRDIQNNWESVVRCYNRLLDMLPFATTGSYADPDMLEVGNRVLSATENRAHFTLWSFLSAPLILGNDVRNATSEEDWMQVVTNTEVIRVNQTAPFLPAKLLDRGEKIDVLAKYLVTGQVGLCFFNHSDYETRLEFDLSTLPEQINGQTFTYTGQSIRPLWKSTDFHQSGKLLQLVLPAHAVGAFIIN